MAEADV
ncbi:hypothetical protein LEMLEM_LOCUS27766 [Lemmus lemmus]